MKRGTGIFLFFATIVLLSVPAQAATAELGVFFGGTTVRVYNGSGWVDVQNINTTPVDGVGVGNNMVLTFKNGDDYGVYSTKNYGADWSQIKLPPNPASIVAWGSSGMAAYTAASPGSVEKYLGTGTNWEWISGGVVTSMAGWSGSELAGSFENWGVGSYDGTTWRHINQNEQNVAINMAGWAGSELAASFAGWGVGSYDGTTWRHINGDSTSIPDSLTGWKDNSLVADFGSDGVWYYHLKDSAWVWDQIVTPWADPSEILVWGDNIAMDFGSNGLWNWTGSGSMSEITYAGSRIDPAGLLTVSSVPVPPALLLLASGLVGLVAMRRKVNL
jgi:hypothetical protein